MRSTASSSNILLVTPRALLLLLLLGCLLRHRCCCCSCCLLFSIFTNRKFIIITTISPSSTARGFTRFSPQSHQRKISYGRIITDTIFLMIKHWILILPYTLFLRSTGHLKITSLYQSLSRARVSIGSLDSAHATTKDGNIRLWVAH